MTALAFCSIGSGPYWAILARKWRSQIRGREGRLLHEVGGSQTFRDNHEPKGNQIIVEKRHLQIWDPEKHSI